MANYKRGRRKNARAGCLMCHGWKANGVKGTAGARTMQEQRADLREEERPPAAQRYKRPKRYSIEWRVVSPDGLASIFGSDWHLLPRRYRTEADRDKALAVLQRKGKADRFSPWRAWEYRAGPTR